MQKLFFLILFLVLRTLADAVPLCRVQRYDENDGLAQWHVTQMLQDRQGMMWFSTWNGLCRFDGYGFQTFKGRVGDGGDISTDRIRNIWLIGDGNIGCRVDEDIFRFNLKTYRFEPAALKQNSRHATSVKEGKPYVYTDAQGTIWTVYHDGTLTYKMAGEAERPYDVLPKMEDVHLCLPDRQGQLWVVSTYSVYKLTFPPQNVRIMRNDGAEVKAIAFDGRGRCWTASKENKMVMVYGIDGRVVGYLSPNGTLSTGKATFGHSVYAIYKSNGGTIWLGCKPGGLFRLKELPGGNGYKVDKIPGMDNNGIYDIKEDRWGRLWLATLGGGISCVVNPNAPHPAVVNPQNGLIGYPKVKAQKVRMLHITQGNILLAATTEGLLVARLTSGNDFGTMSFRLHSREKGRADALSCSATMNICEDFYHRIYISTESGGVNRIENANLLASKLSFRHYGKDCGMPTDVALSVVPFDKSQLMVVSSNQFVLLNPDNGLCVPFGRSFFQSECRFSEALPKRLPDGRWLLGLQDGMLCVNGEKLRKSTFVPDIAFTGLSIQGEHSDLPVNALDTLVLGKRQRSMTLMFAALDYSPDADLRYAFRLEGKNGSDSVWNNVGHDHSVTLLDMAPGTYTLHIRSTNADGVWVENGRKLTIVVTPMFSETTTARVLLILILLVVSGGLLYTAAYIRRIRRQRREALEAYLALLGTNSDKGEKTVVETQTAATHLNGEDDALMRKVSLFVEEHISDAGIGVGDMAEAAAVSRSGLQRKMKQILGVTPLDFLREARIKHACRLLSTTQMSVSEVAYSCGFSDPKYFSRCFKASVGKSPSEYKAT